MAFGADGVEACFASFHFAGVFVGGADRVLKVAAGPVEVEALMETISAAGSSASGSSGPWSSAAPVWFDRTQHANFLCSPQPQKRHGSKIFAAHGVTAFGAAARRRSRGRASRASRATLQSSAAVTRGRIPNSDLAGVFGHVGRIALRPR